jgi:hypothetical protein
VPGRAQDAGGLGACSPHVVYRNLLFDYYDIMLEKIKPLMKEYHHALVAADRAAVLKLQLIPLLRDSQWSSTPFNFADRTIKYQSQERADSLSQRLINSVLRREYPEIADEVMHKILAARKRKTYETLVSIKGSKTAGREERDEERDEEDY